MKRRATPTARTTEPPRTPLARAVGVRQRRDDTSPEVEAMVRARDLGWCVRCGLPIGDGPQSIHPRSPGGTRRPENLILLCGSRASGCCGWVRAHPEDARACGWRLKPGEDPLAVPVAYARRNGGFSEYWLTAGGGRETSPPPEA